MPCHIPASSPLGFRCQLRPILLITLAFLSLPAHAQPARHDTQIDDAINQLSSDDWKARQSATQRLIQLADDALPRLQHVADTATDDEVRTRAAAAVAQIEENKITGASLVTLHLKDAPAAQAFAELAHQARAAHPPPPPGPVSYTQKQPTRLRRIAGCGVRV
jgi:hypothetical protein